MLSLKKKMFHFCTIFALQHSAFGNNNKNKNEARKAARKAWAHNFCRIIQGHVNVSWNLKGACCMEGWEGASEGAYPNIKHTRTPHGRTWLSIGISTELVINSQFVMSVRNKISNNLAYSVYESGTDFVGVVIFCTTENYSLVTPE